MKWFLRFVVLLLLAGGWALSALAVHVVRGINPATGRERWVFVPKSRLGLAYTYADVRAWNLADIAAHPALVTRLIESGKADVLAPAVPTERHGDLVKFLREVMAHPPATAPAR